VPKFAELFDQLAQRGVLPVPTIVLLWLSDFLGRFGVLILIALGGLLVVLRKWAASDSGRTSVDRWKLRLPVFGPIFLNTAISRFSRVLGTLLRNGVPLLKALEISSESAGNRLLSEAIKNSAENISSGDTLSKPLSDCGLFPKPIMAMIGVAEESNNLENVLVSVADGLDRKISRQLDIMVRLIEPVLLLVMGSAILFIIVALLLPVFEMSTSLT
jgi:type II secretory pathway component PulF